MAIIVLVSSIMLDSAKITNQFEIKTEAPVVSVLDIIPILAKKGSLVVSNQTGIHRGIPQSKNGYREVIVLRYK